MRLNEFASNKDTLRKSRVDALLDQVGIALGYRESIRNEVLSAQLDNMTDEQVLNHIKSVIRK